MIGNKNIINHPVLALYIISSVNMDILGHIINTAVKTPVVLCRVILCSV